jgi:hypothetical protein
VDLVGIEPTTSSMPWKRAPKLRHRPTLGRMQLFHCQRWGAIRQTGAALGRRVGAGRRDAGRNGPEGLPPGTIPAQKMAVTGNTLQGFRCLRQWERGDRLNRIPLPTKLGSREAAAAGEGAVPSGCSSRLVGHSGTAGGRSGQPGAGSGNADALAAGRSVFEATRFPGLRYRWMPTVWLLR